MEDPPEGIFTSNILSEYGNYTILGGIWESSGYFLQKTVDVLQDTPETNEHLKMTKNSVNALLTLWET